jgi:AAA family ATP:ADP antiporter
MLPNARLRADAIAALSSYGVRIVGTLGDILLDTTSPQPVRRQIPRVLRAIRSQRSVDVLLSAVAEPDLTVRSQVLKSLSALREADGKLNFGRETLMQYILGEARYYYVMSSALAPFKYENNATPAARLLVETLEERLRLTLERLFRLLGLRYPPKEMYAAYLGAVNRKRTEQHTAAIEFLDNVLERELKRIILPLLDEDSRLVEVARDVFGLEPRDEKEALRELMRAGDSWLVACAVATAAELGFKDLRPEIEPLAHRAGTEVSPVAQSALATLTS